MPPRLPDAPTARSRARFGTAKLFALVLAVAAAVAGAEFYALYQSRQARLAPVQTAPVAEKAVAQPAAEPPIGVIDAPAGEALVGPRVTISGWALAPGGLRDVEVRVDGLAFKATLGIARSDVT